MGKTQGNQTTTQKTELPAWYTGPAKKALTLAETAANNISKPYMGNTVAGLDPMQQQAINATGANIGSTNAAYSAAQNGASQAMNYNPMMVGGQYSPTSVSAGQQGYNYNPTDIAAQSFLQGNVGAYMNPYISNVEQAALGNQQRAFQQNLNTIADQSIGAKAFGSSRQGVLEGVAAAENARQMGDISAQLRGQGFTQAQGMMQSDMDRAMQAQTANQQTGLSNAQFGANIGMQNIGNNLQAALANQQAGYQGAALNQQAALSNQSAGLQGAQLNLQGANNLGDLATQGQAAYLQSLNSALGAGQINQQQAQAYLDQAQNQYNAMRNVPTEQLNLYLAALGGTQVPTSSTTKTPTTGNTFGQVLGGIGSVIGGLGTAGIISDERMKTNIEPLGVDGFTGLPLYGYDYKSDVENARRTGQPMPPKRMGPMAQDIEQVAPDMVRSIGYGGPKVVNFGFGG